MPDSSSTETDFAAYVERRWSALVRYGYLLTGDVQLAQDLVQESLIRCLRHWHKLDEPGRDAYVKKAMARQAARSWRPAPRPDEHTSEEALLTPDSAHHSAIAADIANALATLPKSQRTVVVLRFWLGYDEAEVARMLGCRKGTVKSRASRAYSALRKHLNNYEIDLGKVGQRHE